MCDYSLTGVPSRLAEEGEVLVTHRFSTGSLGLASPSDLCKTAAAVCIPPGARLILQDIPTRLQCDLNVGPAEEVTFTQLTASENTYRDAIRFRNGQQILLQKLREGQRVKVCALSSTQAFERAPEQPEFAIPLAIERG
jgi:hypothetical protein